MNNGAHDAIDSKISQNNLNPKNIKNQVMSETLDVYGLFEDYMFNQGTAIFNAQTQGGDNRFYKRGFSMPGSYADPSDQGATKGQIMQLLSNSINQSPDDTVSTQSVQDLYGLHKQQMPKYQEGGQVMPRKHSAHSSRTDEQSGWEDNQRRIREAYGLSRKTRDLSKLAESLGYGGNIEALQKDLGQMEAEGYRERMGYDYKQRALSDAPEGATLEDNPEWFYMPEPQSEEFIIERWNQEKARQQADSLRGIRAD